MTSLLPSNSDPFEVANNLTRSVDLQEINAAVPFITRAKQLPLPSFLPFLVWEYGLGMLTPYVPNLYDLVLEGVKWERLRGTYAGVAKGLSFIGVTATLVPEWHGRNWWNSNQLNLDALPSVDAPNLAQIEGITRLSLPFRSDLRRGMHGYDVQPAIASGSKYSDCFYGRESGIDFNDSGVIWSFGRTHELDHQLSEAEGEAIGNWLPVPTGTSVRWADMNYPWVSAHVRWAENPTTQRRILMAEWFNGQVLYVRLRNEAGETIGFRRARVARQCAATANGIYSAGGVSYSPSQQGQVVYVEALTDFNDADGVMAATADIIIGASRAEGIPPGRLWLGPDDLTGGHSIAAKSVSIPLRKTVREQFKFVVRF